MEGWVPAPVRDAIAGLSFLTRFDAVSRGVVEARDVVFFVSLIGASLVANAIILETRKAA
jgi:ABC-2 type transport system permease protein